MTSGGFTVVLRGYDRAQVDVALAEAEKLRAAGQLAEAGRRLAEARFDVLMRGYDRGQVDAYIKAWPNQ